MGRFKSLLFGVSFNFVFLSSGTPSLINTVIKSPLMFSILGEKKKSQPLPRISYVAGTTV